MARFQEKTITASNPTVTFIGDPGPIALTGDFDAGTITQTYPGDTTAIATFTASDTIDLFSGQDVTFTMTGAGGSESVSIKWYRHKVPY